MQRHPTGRHLVLFFAIAFGITWGLGIVVALARESFEAALGPIEFGHPIVFVAIYAPTLAALIVSAVAGGLGAVKRYSSRVLNFRAPLWCYLVVLAGYPAVLLFSRWLGGGQSWSQFALEGTALGTILLSVVGSLVLDPGPMEEPGWRGFALPLLQQHFNALTSSLILGFAWGLWHLPAFLISDMPQGGAFLFPIFVLGSIVLSIIMTALYNGSGGCVPLMFLFHWIGNDPLEIGKQEFQLQFGILILALASLLVWRLGPRNLGRRRVTSPFADGNERRS